MKKVLSFVLVLSLVLSSFSMAFAGETKTAGLSDIEGVANEAAITVVNDLGIVTGYEDGTFKAEKAVKRAEFAVMLTKALNIPESALAGYTATSFTDVAGYEWAVPYLAFCESKGIMSGYGEGIVKPGNTITVNEAMTMALRAMGLTPNSAWLVGTWPSNYVSIAQMVDLYDDVATATTVDRGNAAQIIYNSLLVGTFVVNAEGTTTLFEGDTMIEALGCTTAAGIVGSDALAYETLIPVSDYVGANATVFLNDGLEIVAVDVESTFLVGNFTLDGTTYKFETEDATYKLANKFGATSTAGIDFNNTDNSVGTVTIGALATSEETVKISVDLAGKTINVLHALILWDVETNHFVAEDDVQEDIANLKLGNGNFIEDKNGEINFAKFELYGVASLDKISEGDVVYTYLNDNGDIVKVEVCDDVVEGTITKKVTNATGTTYIINGNEYEVAGQTSGEHEALNVGDTGTALLDYSGDIYQWTVESGVAGNYAVFVADDVDSGLFGDDVIVIKLFTKEGKEITPALDMDKDAVVALVSDTGIAANTIVEYSLNKDGEVDGLSTTAAVYGNDDVDGASVAENGALIGNQKVASNVIVFVKDGTDYAVGKMADLKSSITASAVVNGTTNVIEALIVDASYTKTTDTFGIVTSYDVETLDADGDKVPAADIILGGVVKTDVIDRTNKATTNSAANSTALKVITIDADGEITAIANAEDTYATACGVTIKAIDGKILKTDEATAQYYQVTDDVVIYVVDADGNWTVAEKLSAVKGCVVYLYDTDDEAPDADGVYDVIVAVEQ